MNVKIFSRETRMDNITTIVLADIIVKINSAPEKFKRSHDTIIFNYRVKDQMIVSWKIRHPDCLEYVKTTVKKDSMIPFAIYHYNKEDNGIFIIDMNIFNLEALKKSTDDKLEIIVLEASGETFKYFLSRLPLIELIELSTLKV
uniref:Uncharacterized protein n=1 Tax=Pithovirus LCPAC401 TaxID=2506595 RepID=A0A481ZB65_9VIRU|nr:MAG: hypothetical protein LCPAC401_02100 [Pithovirus LCPAC401]